MSILAPVRRAYGRILGFAPGGGLTLVTAASTALYFRLNGHTPTTSTGHPFAGPSAFIASVEALVFQSNALVLIGVRFPALGP